MMSIDKNVVILVKKSTYQKLFKKWKEATAYDTFEISRKEAEWERALYVFFSAWWKM